MTLAKYAVFLPVRNGAMYVREAIESVIAQTSADWMLVVLDNASSDGSAELACTYRDPRIQVHRSGMDLPIWESWHRIWAILANGDVDVAYATAQKILVTNVPDYCIEDVVDHALAEISLGHG